LICVTDADLIGVVVQIQQTTNGAYVAPFVSEDGGASLTAWPTENTILWQNAVFTSATSATVIAGAGNNRAWVTSDSGLKWSAVDVKGDELGPLVPDRTGELLLGSIGVDDNSATFTEYASTERGQEFAATSPPLTLPSNAENVIVGAADATWWVIAGDTTFRTSDGGASWHTSPSGAAPRAIARLVTTDSENAAAVTQTDSCSKETGACSTSG